MKFDDCYKCRNQAVWYSFFVNLFQASFKGLLGGLSGSAALIADGLHSSADVVASAVTMVSLKISSKPPSEKYAYGYGKIQFISESIVGIILIIGALYLLVNSSIAIYTGNVTAPNKIAILGAVVSIILNQLLFYFQRCVGTENKSPAIMASAWDNRSDALSSMAVLVGIILASFGYPIADPFGAIVVSFMIIKIGTELNYDAYNGLMDRSPDLEELHEVYYATKQVLGVLGILSLKIRRHGEMSHVDIQIKVKPDYKVYEADLIALAVKQNVEKIRERSEVRVFLGV